jgi:Arc/MetJ-type ribon-helix-helix transcriptional regulator
METSDRITIRLEQEILARMDAFLQRTSRFGSRSHLCRVAVDQFLESVEGFSNRVTVEIPKAYLDFIDALVEKGYFISREQAVQRLVTEGLSKDRIGEILEHHETMGRAAGKIFPVELEKEDSTR